MALKPGKLLTTYGLKTGLRLVRRTVPDFLRNLTFNMKQEILLIVG